MRKIFESDYLHKALKYYYGYENFRPGQEEVVKSILDGYPVLALLPTGAGKSICFQLPSLLLPGVTLVISPLVSLMRDQSEKLNKQGIKAACLDSSLSGSEYGKVLYSVRAGACKFLYVAPERLRNKSFRGFAKEMNVTLLAVDEAHCVSRWGQSFREDYNNIPEFTDILLQKPRITAFTATATHAVRQDIISKLAMEGAKTISTGFDRKNLFFFVKKNSDKNRALLDFLEKHRGKCGIVYCATRNKVEETAALLRKSGYNAIRYHAGLTAEERKRSQQEFVRGESVVMAATNAFGMGIDKPDVRFVIHLNMPKDVESYYQEAGRAGRDGLPADCLLFYSGQDAEINNYLIDSGCADSTRREYERSLLKKMVDYCNTSGCLRKYLLNYFGEKFAEKCCQCSNCLRETRNFFRLR